LSAFSCSESEEIILESEPEPFLLMKFINESDYDLSELKMFGKTQLPNLAVGQETEFIEMDTYTYPYSAKINHKVQDTVGRPPRKICGNETHEVITKGKYTVKLTVALGYTDWDFSGYDYIEPYECLFLFSEIVKE